jgi:large conductance mechanosensitive channel
MFHHETPDPLKHETFMFGRSLKIIMNDIEKQPEKRLKLSEKALNGSKKTVKKVGTFFQSFKDFINRGNVVDLAVGIVMGTAFGLVVNSFVVDLVSPFIALTAPGKSFDNHFFILQCPRDNRTDTVTACSYRQFTTVESANAAGAISLNYGSFLQVYNI